jgi:hypothetical protein
VVFATVFVGALVLSFGGWTNVENPKIDADLLSGFVGNMAQPPVIGGTAPRW